MPSDTPLLRGRRFISLYACCLTCHFHVRSLQYTFPVEGHTIIHRVSIIKNKIKRNTYQKHIHRFLPSCISYSCELLDIFWHIAQVFVLSLRCRPASHWLMCFRKIPAAAKTKNTLKHHSREVSSSTFLLFQIRSPQLGIFKWKKGKGKLKKISQAKTTPLWNSSRPNSPLQVIPGPCILLPSRGVAP